MGTSRIMSGMAALSIVAGALLVIPTAANAADQVIELDCSVANYGGTELYMTDGDTLTITTTNCDLGYASDYYSGDRADHLADFDTDVLAIDGDTTVTYTANSHGVANYWAGIGFEGSGGSAVVFFYVWPYLDDPRGTLRESTTIDLTESAVGDLDFTEVSEDLGMNGFAHHIFGYPECSVEAGTHAYATVDVQVAEAGWYTLRTYSADGTFAGPPTVLILDTLASGAPAESTTLACSDGRPFAGFLPDFHAITENQAEISMMLQPGTYRAVLADEQAGSAADIAGNADIGPVVFEVWSDAPPAELAETGVRAGELMPAGVALMVMGVAILALRRVRRRA